MASEYPYRPLDYRVSEFRLLVFENTYPVNPSKLLSCYIQHGNMQQAALVPDFYAVSYTWSDSARRSTIIVDGKRVSVPQSAELALRQFVNQLHDHGRSQDTRPRRLYFWIDSICVNQSDLKERSRQLSLMNAIYAEAKTVMIWLGEDEKDMGAAAVQSVQDVVEQCKAETNDLNDLFKHLWNTKARRLSIRASKGALPSSCDLDALRKFYSARWFTRLWVLQEACLAKAALCFWGSHCVPLYDVALAAQWMWFRGRGQLTPDDTVTSSHVVGIRNATEIWDCMSTPYATPKSLWTVLAVGMQFDTSDPLDKIYGMYGIIQLWLDQIPELDFVPDYSVSLAQLYAVATKAAILDSGNLAILGIASRAVNPRPSKNDDNIYMPSWIPRLDWVIDRSRGSTCSIQPPMRGASNGSPVQLSHIEGLWDVLVVHGLAVEEIAHTLPLGPSSANDGPEGTTSALATAWSSTQAHADRKLNTPFELAFALTLCAGQDSTYFSVIGDTDFGDSAASFFKHSSSKTLSQLGDTLHTVIARRKDSVQGYDAEPDTYLKALTNTIANRSFFITTSGRMGIGPSQIQKGDQITIVPGSAVPLVLRKDGIFWDFVGDAYVHGIMDGRHYCELDAFGKLSESIQCFHIQ